MQVIGIQRDWLSNIHSLSIPQWLGCAYWKNSREVNDVPNAMNVVINLDVPTLYCVPNNLNVHIG